MATGYRAHVLYRDAITYQGVSPAVTVTPGVIANVVSAPSVSATGGGPVLHAAVIMAPS